MSLATAVILAVWPAFGSVPQRSRAHAAERSAAVSAATRAILRGDLQRAQLAARGAAEAVEPAPPLTRVRFDASRTAARQLERTRDVVAAAKATATLARACGTCHEDLGVSIEFREDAAPPAGTRLVFEMARYEWAFTRMSDGLVGPSDARWQEGARLLAGAQVSMVAEVESDPGRGHASDIMRVRLLANRALTVPERQREALYGELLATCARCHSSIRDR